jgi:hypothetical protein
MEDKTKAGVKMCALSLRASIDCIVRILMTTVIQRYIHTMMEIEPLSAYVMGACFLFWCFIPFIDFYGGESWSKFKFN